MDLTKPHSSRMNRGTQGVGPMGYKDSKIIYEATGMNNSLYLKVKIQKANFLRVCGNYVKDSLKHVLFFLGNISTFILEIF